VTFGRYSSQTLDALAEAFTGGSGSSPAPSIGLYRRGFEIEKDMLSLGFKFALAPSSRVPAVRLTLARANETEAGRSLIAALFELTCDPRDFLDKPEKLPAVVEYLNKRLTFDGLELQKAGRRYRLLPTPGTQPASKTLMSSAERLGLESVLADFERALAQVDADPEDAITAACSTIESVCKCLLDEMGEPYPQKQDISALVKAVAAKLNLSPARPDIEPDVKQVLGGLSNVTAGIGSLRTHCGDAHGRGKGVKRVDARIARLSVHTASAVAVFFIETWQKREEKNASTS
jgi:hypothetical protein